MMEQEACKNKYRIREMCIKNGRKEFPMDVKRTLFLPALCAAIRNEKVDWQEFYEPEIWQELFLTAKEHQVLPMICQAVYSCPSAQQADPEIFRPWKENMVRLVTLQTMKTTEFLRLWKFLQKEGITPLLVKGLICRRLYPNPDFRMSGDEDLLVPKAQHAACKKVLRRYGMQNVQPDAFDTAYETAYQKPGSPLYIEVHTSLFPPESAAYGEWNCFFEDIWENPFAVSEEGTTMVSLQPTDHLFYLLCHACKHVLHSGIGVRQVCDLLLFAETYGKQIEWDRVMKQCEKIQIDLFAAALFRIGQKHLGFLPEKAGFPKKWQNIKVDEEPLLCDLLLAGSYGNSTRSRLHSSNLTLQAAVAERQGKKAGSGVLQTIFPTGQQLNERFPYLKEKPFLLPAAWAERAWRYAKEKDSPMDAWKIGRQRILLLKEYGILRK